MSTAVQPEAPPALPPHDPQAEAAILGAAIWDPDRAPGLRPEWFYLKAHRAIFRAVQGLQESGRPIDVGFVAQALPGGPTADWCAAINHCMDACHSPHNWNYWAEDLNRCAGLRRLIAEGTATALDASESGAEPKALARRMADGAALVQAMGTPTAGDATTAAVLQSIIKRWEDNYAGKKPTYEPTGFRDLDGIVGGFEPRQFWILAARPSVGKTSLALNMATNLAVDRGVSVGFLSLEMGKRELLTRAILSIARQDFQQSRQAGERDFHAQADAVGRISQAPLFIDDAPTSLADINAAVAKLVKEHSVRVVVVDYLGLVTLDQPTKSLYERVSIVSGGLKRIAKQHDVALLALCQLNRESEKSGRVPRISDIRESGNIEQDADVILLLSPNDNGTVRAEVGKNRNGPTGFFSLVFLREITRFESASKIDPADVPRSYMKD